jgi:hypothetical protein
MLQKWGQEEEKNTKRTKGAAYHLNSIMLDASHAFHVQNETSSY